MESAHLVKVFAILEATAGKPDGVALAELAATVGLPKSTTHRLLKTLCTLGYTNKLEGGIYQQTNLIRRLSIGANDPMWVSVADPVMQELHDATGETINLGILRFQRVCYLHVIESKETLRRSISPQMTDPCFSTSLGRAIVAFLPVKRQEFLLRHATLEKRTPKTVVDHDELLAILRQVKTDGLATETDQTDLGVSCIAAPIFDSQAVAAAISLSAPQVRMDAIDPDELARQVKAAAAKISERLKAA